MGLEPRLKRPANFSGGEIGRADGAWGERVVALPMALP